MKYSFKDTVLGESILTLLSLHFMVKRKGGFSNSLKRVSYAVFGQSDIMKGVYVDVDRRAEFATMYAQYPRWRYEEKFAIRIPLHKNPTESIHKISLVVLYNDYNAGTEYYLQIKMTEGSEWATVVSNERRKELLEIMGRFCDPIERRRKESVKNTPWIG